VFDIFVGHVRQKRSNVSEFILLKLLFDKVVSSPLEGGDICTHYPLARRLEHIEGPGLEFPRKRRTVQRH
jgi:hypothetical protein